MRIIPFALAGTLMASMAALLSAPPVPAAGAPREMTEHALMPSGSTQREELGGNYRVRSSHTELEVPTLAPAQKPATASSANATSRHGNGDDDANEYEYEHYEFRYDTNVLEIEVNAEDIPCTVHVQGDVFNAKGKDIGDYEANFPNCPTLQPIPPELAGNAFGIPVGTEMPAWDGPVDYFLKKGDVNTFERAWIFPPDPNVPQSLAVLSTGEILDGSDAYDDAVGQVVTPDGLDGVGSLIIDIGLPED